MPPVEEIDIATRPTILDALGPFPLFLAAAFALAIIALLVTGIIKRKRRDSIDRCLLLLFVVAGLAFLSGVIRSSTHAAVIHEILSRAGRPRLRPVPNRMGTPIFLLGRPLRAAGCRTACVV